jgi:cytochrome d ubiquinol oxidase subunit I
MEAEWDTEPPPSDFVLFGFPDQETQKTMGAIRIPWVGGIIVTRSIDTPIIGVKELVSLSENRIRSGMVAYDMLEKIRAGKTSNAHMAQFKAHQQDLGYGLLLKAFTKNVAKATDEQIRQAALMTIPNVAAMFWSFRIMVGLGFWMLVLIALSFYFCAKRSFEKKRWLLRLLIISLPAPWIAAELGWFVSEYGRQPWTVGEVLPTFLSVSNLTQADLIGSILGLVLLYTIFLVIEI